MDAGVNNDIVIMWGCALVLALVFALVVMCTDKFMKWLARRRANKALRMFAWPK